MAARNPNLSEATWRRSSRSSSTGQNCVEVATNLHGVVAVRDSKDPVGPKLVVSTAGWRTFLDMLTERLPASESPCVGPDTASPSSHQRRSVTSAIVVNEPTYVADLTAVASTSPYERNYRYYNNYQRE